MKVSDITQAYCNRNDLVLYKGRKIGENDPSPILPFLIMDYAYCEFCKVIKPIPLHHEAKRLRNKWLATYTTFNKRLLSCLTEEQKDYAIEMMDAYTGAVDYEAMLIRVATMDLVKDCKFADQCIMGALLLCHILAQVAGIVWEIVFRNDYGREDKCHELELMTRQAHQLGNMVVELPSYVNPNKDKRLTDAVEAFKDKTIKWLNSYGKENL